MKSFKALTLLTFAAALSGGANGSPALATNATIDYFIKRQNEDELIAVMKSLSDTASKLWNDNHKDSAAFTQAFVKAMTDKNAHYNYVICQVEHVFQFDGEQWIDWANSFVTTSNINWDVVVGGAGMFIRRGEQGYDNWAWKGVVVKGQNLHSPKVDFVKPVTGGTHQVGGN